MVFLPTFVTEESARFQLADSVNKDPMQVDGPSEILGDCIDLPSGNCASNDGKELRGLTFQPTPITPAEVLLSF